MGVAFDHHLAEMQPDELRRRLSGLSTLVDVTRELAAQIDLDDTLRAISHHACRALECERASVFQYDHRREELFTRVATELEISEIRSSVNEGVIGWVARNREAAQVADPHGDWRWNSAVDQQTGFSTHNLLAVPISSPHSDRLTGVLELINRRGRVFDEFDLELANVFAQHAAVALDRARLVEELRIRNATEASLDIAREIQRGFMPSQLPQTPGYQLATWWYPNEAVGGDYCDVTPMRDGRMGLVVADVSGHGLGPSLLMASVRAGLRALMLEQSSPDTLLASLAQSLAGDLRDGRFITMVLATLDFQNHTLEYSNAGHAPAMHYSARTGRFTMLEATGLPLGIIDAPSYPCGPRLNMETGDVVVLCTDGIIEAMDECEVQFGMERLQEIVAGHANRPLADLVHEIGARVSAHHVGENPPDDLTVLAVTRTGS